MPSPSPGRQAKLRALIEDFLRSRCKEKLEGLAAADPKRSAVIQQFHRTSWIDDAARRVGQIQVVTHSLKPTHPDAKGTNLYCPPGTLPVLSEVGSHVLGLDFTGDVVGNAAALDVYKFLKLSYEGQSLLDLALAQDADLAAAFSDDLRQGHCWMDAFAGIARPRGVPASHALAKQLYWLVGEDPANDGHFHLLAPLYGTSLAHQVYQKINEDRFGERAAQARQAKREKRHDMEPVREYPNLAMQKFGGSKPQNISQLNSERKGNSYLLASLPPVWKSPEVAPLLHVKSMFDRFERRKAARELLNELRALFQSKAPANERTRSLRVALVNRLIDELLLFVDALRTLSPGWTQSADCRLSPPQKQWLDWEGVANAAQEGPAQLLPEWRKEMAGEFGRWLNGRLRDPLPMGDPEYMQWCRDIEESLAAFEWEMEHAE